MEKKKELKLLQISIRIIWIIQWDNIVLDKPYIFSIGQKLTDVL